MHIGLFLGQTNHDKAEAARHAWVCSSEKAAGVVGYVPEVGLVEGFAATVAWYRAEGWL